MRLRSHLAWGPVLKPFVNHTNDATGVQQQIDPFWCVLLERVEGFEHSLTPSVHFPLAHDGIRLTKSQPASRLTKTEEFCA